MQKYNPFKSLHTYKSILLLVGCSFWGCRCPARVEATAAPYHQLQPAARLSISSRHVHKHTYSTCIYLNTWPATWINMNRYTQHSHNTSSTVGLILLSSSAGQDKNLLVKNTYMQIHTYGLNLNLPSNWPLGSPGSACKRGGFRGTSQQPLRTCQETRAGILTEIRNNKHKLKQKV